MLKLELFEEENNKFLENLNYQISKIYSFYKKIPNFNQNKEMSNFETGFKENIFLSKNNKEGKRSENSYTIMMKELETLLQKYKNKQKFKHQIEKGEQIELF